MDKIELDCTKLLGFKIIADGGSTVRLTSPKIGDKGCGTINQDVAIAQVVGTDPLAAKIGTKTD